MINNSSSSSVTLCDRRRGQIRHVLLLNYNPCSEENSLPKSTVSIALTDSSGDDGKKHHDVASNNRFKRPHGDSEQLSNGSNGNAWMHAAEANDAIRCRSTWHPPVAQHVQNQTTITKTIHSMHYAGDPQHTISNLHYFHQHGMMMIPNHSLFHWTGNHQHPIAATIPIDPQGIWGTRHQVYPSPHPSSISWQPNPHSQLMYSTFNQQPHRTWATWHRPYPTSIHNQLPLFNSSCGHDPLTNFAPSHSHLGHFHHVNSMVFPSQSMNTHVYPSHPKQGKVDNLSVEYCDANLNPAPIPFNPLDDDDEQNDNAGELTNHLEKECAWLVEETAFLLPFLQNATKTPTFINTTNSSMTVATHATSVTTDENQNCSMLFDLAWLFGSFELRTILFDRKPTLVMNKWNDSEMTVEGLCKREEARAGLKLGYRRSESIGEILDSVRRFRLRNALEERGDAVDDDMFESLAIKKNRRRRKRKEGFVVGRDISRLTLRERDGIAMQKPGELTDLEEETAWLCEESLLLPPKTFNALTPANDRYEVKISAGLLTEGPDVNWTYVVENASPSLKVALQKVRGQIGNRTLQRIVRYSNIHVRIAFFKRREDIANLLVVGGYRRSPMKEVLPSHEELVLSGFLDVLKAKLMRRVQSNPKTYYLASTDELRRACNRRLGDQSTSTCKSRKEKRANRPQSIDETSCFHHDINERLIAPLQSVECVKKPRLSERELDSSNALPSSESQPSSKLTVNEEEIAWLREEYEIETGGLAGFDWEYIENYSTSRLRQEMLNRGVLFSRFPTVCGVSKLKAMVRIEDPKVYVVFQRKRRDIRFAIKNGFRRDLRKDILPDIPRAPERIVGARVMDVEFVNEGDQVNESGSGVNPGR